MITRGEKNLDLEQLYNKPNTLKLQYYEVSMDNKNRIL